MALKKSDLYRSLWASCDQLRGGMDASQYKDYILTLLFMKFVSDKARADSNSLINVPKGGSFDDMLAAKGNKEIGDQFNKIIGRLAEANDLRNVIDQADFNDEEKLGKGKEMQDRLSKLVTIFNDLDFRGSRAEGDDLLGDAYEYLMRHFATESGKSKGQFYTPAEVSRILAKVVGINSNTKQDETVFDPTCGSGSLLLKAADEAPRGMTIYGQEKDNATWALARMNMILHGNEIAEIAKGDTITSPQFTSGNQLRTFDYVVMNPPFSTKSWSNGLDVQYGRFEYGRPPEKNGDYAFLLHALKSLKSTGKAAIILPHGVLFRGNVEAAIRTRLLKHGFIKGIIGLPPNLFYGTGIPACIVVLDKENAVGRTGVFMVDASNGFMKDGAKNRLRSQDIHRIVDTFTKQIEIDRYSRLVPLSEIADESNDYNLNIPRYIDSSEPEDLQDLDAHLHGGIPDRDLDSLGEYWEVFPGLCEQMFKPNRAGYSDLAIEVADVQQAILESPGFLTLCADVASIVDDWYAKHRKTLLGITADTKPAELIHELSEDFLASFKAVPLLDEYDAYQELMAYWHDVMHDDVFLLMNDGWVEASKPRAARVIGKTDAGKDQYEDAHIKRGTGKNTERYVMDLVPPELVIARYFPELRDKVMSLKLKAEDATQTVQEFTERHGVEDGAVWEAVGDNGKLTQASVNAELTVAKASGDEESIEAYQQALGLLRAETAAKSAAKTAQAELDDTTLRKYGDLTEGELQSLVLDGKWHATVGERIDAEVRDLTRVLVGRVEQLGRRYGATLHDVEVLVRSLANSVNDVLGKIEAIEPTATVRLRDIGGTYGGLTGKTKADFGRGDGTFVTFLEVINNIRLYGHSLESVIVSRGERQHRVMKGDLLFNGSSETPEEVALSSVVAYEPLPATYLNSFCFGYRLKRHDIVDPTYLAYFFRTRQGRALVSSLAQGATRYNIAKTKLLDVEIPIPTLAQQRDVVTSVIESENLVGALASLTEKRRWIGEGISQTMFAPARLTHE